ncbi:serpin family protein [Fusibacter bizertensis]
MNYLKGALSIILCLTLLAGCATSQVKAPIKSNISFAGTSLETVSDTFLDSVNTSNRLGYNLLSSMQDGNNTLFSPVSLSMALAMAYTASSGETAINIADIMGDADPKMITTHYNALIAHLDRTNEEDKIQIGNSFWIRDTLKAKQSFIDTLSKDFGAEIHNVNFSDKNTLKLINTWVEEKTNGLLKDTLKEIDASTIAYLMNTIYFNGRWVNEFKKETTSSMPFYLENAVSKSVSMMSQTNSFDYYANADVQVAALPYKDQTRMVIYLPKGNLSDFIADYNYEMIAKLTSDDQMINTRLELSLPKFEYNVSNPLKTPLIEMGLTLPFDKNNADFSNMVEVPNENVFIGDIFQNARIINDEGGTEAAAVTVIEFGVTSMPMVDEPIQFNCNKPFLYMIEDVTTGAALFMGTYCGQ